MPRINRQVKHDLGKEELIARIAHATKRAKAMSVFKEQWTGDTMEFSAAVQGVRLSGFIRVGDTALDIEVSLPLIALPFSGWLDGMIAWVLKHPVTGAAGSPSTEAGSPVFPESREPVILFLHIPKAAGTTLGEFVFDNCRLEGVADGALPQEELFKKGVYYFPFGFFKDAGDPDPERIGPVLSHPALRAVIGHFSFGLHSRIGRPSSYITLLRHPLDRVTSLYSFLKAKDQLSVEAFLELDYPELDNDQTRRISGANPGFGKCDRSHLETAKEHLERHFSVAGTSERFDETLILLKRRLGWSGNYFPTPKNVTPDRRKTNQFPPAIQERILELNQLDAELHHHVSRLLDQAVEAEGAGFQEDLRRLQSIRQNGQP